MTIKKFKDLVERSIEEWLTQYEKEAPSSECKVLVARIRSLILRDGKRARPLLLYITYRGYGGQNIEQLTELAVVLELHHQFLLMHDDVIDNDSVRYDGPNITGYYSHDAGINTQSAETMGVLAGDLLLSYAQRILHKSELYDQALKISLLALLHDTNIGVGYGQLMDSFNLDPDSAHFDERKLLQIHTLKSALYSTHLPMQAAALLLNLNKTERAKIKLFAEPFGILFQLVDDYSDYFINASAFNNRTKYRDYRQGKITYPLYQGLLLTNKAEQAYLHDHLGIKSLSDHDMQRVIAILETCGAKQASASFIEPYFQATLSALSVLAIDNRYKKALRDIIESYKV